jgi:hypothetical protein
MVLFALMLPALIALVGLAVDGGRLLAERRHLQAAADAAAWAAAADLVYGTPERAEATARWYVSRDTGGDPAVQVTVNGPPTQGPYAGLPDYASVRVARPLVLTLAQIVHPEPILVVAEATGGPTVGPAPYALLALNSGAGGIELNGTVTVRDGSAASNYRISSRGRGSLVADGVVVANQGLAGDVHGLRGTRGDFATTPDPLLRLAAPSAPATSQPGLSLSGNGNAVTVQPGRWIGDLRVGGSDNVVTLAPGLYYFDQGASLDATGGGNRVVGDGVIIYLARGSTINVAGGADLVLNASPSPVYTGGAAGLLVFSARDNSTRLDLNGGASSTLVGTIYAPAAPVRLTGQSAAAVRGQLIAERLDLGGTSDLIVVYDPAVSVRQPRPALLR